MSLRSVAQIIGMELMTITETTLSSPINIFTLPDGKVINSFTRVDSFEFLMISQNIINSYADRITLLEKAANYLSDQLKRTGVVTKKEAPRVISAKMLRLFMSAWEKRMGDIEFYLAQSTYSTDYKVMQFIAK